MDQVTAYYYNHNVNVKPKYIRGNKIPYYDLTIVLGGVLYYVNHGATIALKAGDCILIRPGEYRQRLDSEIVSEYVSFNFSSEMDLSSVPTVSTDVLNAEIKLLLNACDGFPNTDGALKKITYILGALLVVLRESVNNAQKHPLALEIKNYILKNYTERITLQSISERFHFSVPYCNNVFKKEMKKPIVDFLIGERIRKAKELLIYTGFSLPEIASRVGYEDYNYFSRLFKKHTHYTPTQYRVRHTGR
ncbi:MAG: helix-turn-helix domain-containing protein [Clostridia bacterium]|nr:helix-turn-helix domain-containing protein [Clostridia bacterium]